MDHGAVQVDTDKNSACAGISQHVSIELPVGAGGSVATQWPGCNGGVAAQLELRAKQVFSTFIGHEQHDQINAFHSDFCAPQLPPEIVKNAVALQPAAVRQVATPLPCSAPKIKPPSTMEGTTATHFADFRTSSGIPLSFALSSSFRTFADSFSRWFSAASDLYLQWRPRRWSSVALRIGRPDPSALGRRLRDISLCFSLKFCDQAVCGRRAQRRQPRNCFRSALYRAIALPSSQIEVCLTFCGNAEVMGMSA